VSRGWLQIILASVARTCQEHQSAHTNVICTDNVRRYVEMENARLSATSPSDASRDVGQKIDQLPPDMTKPTVIMINNWHCCAADCFSWFDTVGKETTCTCASAVDRPSATASVAHTCEKCRTEAILKLKRHDSLHHLFSQGSFRCVEARGSGYG